MGFYIIEGNKYIYSLKRYQNLGKKPVTIFFEEGADSLHDVAMNAFDLTISLNTSVNSAHAQCFNTIYQNKTFHDQRVVYNMAVDKHIC